MGSLVSRLSSIFGNSTIFEVMYVSIFRASLVEPASSACVAQYRATCSRLAPPDYRAVDVLHARPKDLAVTSDATF